ncbi:SGNH/GDSL hydrolase family protein [Streptomyces sp. NPDC017254]|uniref:SGNH/GDSL hydrolase family protein n=1 Tax=unclassified Streptomyces TaxID=2593676 RepID=UPI0037B98FAF
MTRDQASASAVVSEPVVVPAPVAPSASAVVSEPVVVPVPAAVPGQGTTFVPAPVPPTRHGAGSGRGTGTGTGMGPTGTVRFVVLGDSLSEGVGDRVEGAWRGWAPLLAEGLAAEGRRTALLNLAVSGALSGDVANRQAPRALAFRPHLASVVVGVNDTLRRTFDIGLLAHHLDRVLADLDAAGAILLTACLPDPGRMLGLPPPLARPLARRQRSVNAVVHALSVRYRAVHLHLAGDTWTEDRTLWSADRLHPGERGHRAVAEGFHRLLADRGLAHGAAPEREPLQPPPTRAEAVLWLATAGTRWLLRRSHDLLPQLLLLAGAELRHWADGTGPAPLDARADDALAAALAATMGR